MPNPPTEPRLTTLPRLANGEADVYNPIWIDYLVGLLTRITHVPSINAEVVEALLLIGAVTVRVTATGFDIVGHNIFDIRHA